MAKERGEEDHGRNVHSICTRIQSSDGLNETLSNMGKWTNRIMECMKNTQGMKKGS